MSYTNKQVMDALTAINARLDALAQAPAPAKSAPVVGTAEAPLYVSERVACARADHAGACTRSFGKAEYAEGSHVACAGADDAAHTMLRKSHKHI